MTGSAAYSAAEPHHGQQEAHHAARAVECSVLWPAVEWRIWCRVRFVYMLHGTPLHNTQ